VRRAEPLAGLGGIATIAGVLIGGVGVTGVVLIGLGLLALAVPIVTLTTSGPARSMGAAVLASAFGWIGIVLALARIVGDASTGDWLALAGAVLAWAGSWLSMSDETTPGAVAPDVPRRPAPT